MSEFNYENMITENLLSYPITSAIKSAARDDGVDVDAFKTQVLSLGSSAFMSGFIGPILGGPLGFIAGLLGYAIGLAGGSKRSESRDEYIKRSSITAARRLSDLLPDWLANEIGDAVINYGKTHDVDDMSVEEALRTIYSIIYNIDRKAANLWLTLYQEEVDHLV